MCVPVSSQSLASCTWQTAVVLKQGSPQKLGIYCDAIRSKLLLSFDGGKKKRKTIKIFISPHSSGT